MLGHSGADQLGVGDASVSSSTAGADVGDFVVDDDGLEEGLVPALFPHADGSTGEGVFSEGQGEFIGGLIERNEGDIHTGGEIGFLRGKGDPGGANFEALGEVGDGGEVSEVFVFAGECQGGGLGGGGGRGMQGGAAGAELTTAGFVYGVLILGGEEEGAVVAGEGVAGAGGGGGREGGGGEAAPAGGRRKSTAEAEAGRHRGRRGSGRRDDGEEG